MSSGIEGGEVEIPQWLVDFEASGIAPDSYPIEIAVVSSAGQYQALIRPCRYWTYWSWDAQDIHGIAKDILLIDGLEPSLIAAELNVRFDGAKLCSDSPQDVFWLDTLYEAAGVEPSFALLPLECFVGRVAAGEIYRMMPASRAHRALPDEAALMATTLEYLARAK
ncbi:hypothetical protein [Pseudomonas sp.]|uniref:hypothetical protein n=1 Tax=Pseudomonas sp. TaxID=306 RepID=UPI00326737B0